MDLKQGIKVSHEPNPETEDYLVNLLVQRCKLLVETGRISKAIGMMQGLTEFHLFAPLLDIKDPQLRFNQLMSQFCEFWNSGVPRIGEEGALGWSNNTSFGCQEDLAVREAHLLKEQRRETRVLEDEIVEICTTRGQSILEVYRILELYREPRYANPIHFLHDDEQIFEVCLSAS